MTFDTGGISIKPSAKNMHLMKHDMAGGAAMVGAMLAIASLRPSVDVTAVIPSVENMPGGSAQRPGDIVTTMSGKTVEVLNTDAEGRLILADAIAYAKDQGCTHLVDAATLTGAIVVALGTTYTGLFGNDQAWADQVVKASKAAGEKMWPMPLGEEYSAQLDSPVADLANIGPPLGRRRHRGGLSRGVCRRHALGPPRHRRHRLVREEGPARARRTDRCGRADAGGTCAGTLVAPAGAPDGTRS